MCPDTRLFWGHGASLCDPLCVCFSPLGKSGPVTSARCCCRRRTVPSSLPAGGHPWLLSRQSARQLIDAEARGCSAGFSAGRATQKSGETTSLFLLAPHLHKKHAGLSAARHSRPRQAEHCSKRSHSTSSPANQSVRKPAGQEARNPSRETRRARRARITHVQYAVSNQS